MAMRLRGKTLRTAVAVCQMRRRVHGRWQGCCHVTSYQLLHLRLGPAMMGTGRESKIGQCDNRCSPKPVAGYGDRW